MMDHKQDIPPGLMKNCRNIICDFDGTIARFDVTDAVLERFAPPAWEEAEKEWRDGMITARECMERQARMINASPARLKAFLATVPLTDGFAAFTRFCAARRLNMRIVSDGMDYAIQCILAAHNLAGIPVIANRLRFHDGSGYRLEFPHSAEGCGSGVCKCAAAKGGKVLLIGDGHSDLCLAGAASFVLARRNKVLHRHCVEKNIPHAAYDDFFDIVRFLTPETEKSPLLYERKEKNRKRTERRCEA